MIFRPTILVGMAAVVLVGCSTNIGLPQSREEFINVYKDGGLFRNAEHYTISRPKSAVAADIGQFADKCLHVKVTTTIQQGYAMDRSTTTFHPKMVEIKGGVTSLTVQETYRDKPEEGHPRGGMYSLVADISSQGGKTKLDIYHAGRGPVAQSIKDWAEGNKSSCPKF